LAQNTFGQGVCLEDDGDISLLLFPPCFPQGNGACDLGNVQFSCELLVDGKASQKLQHSVDALTQQCIWAYFSKAMPQNQQKKM